VREPLLHFLVLGVGLFALFDLVGADAPDSRRIVVGPGTLENLAATFARTWQRPPTRAELEGLVAGHVREEILYREAVTLGLDADDVIVRRRMRQKMELLAESFGEAEEPGEADLETWLREHADRYRSEPRLGFRHVYLSRDLRGEDVESVAARLLEALRAGGDPGALGDPISLPGELRDAPLSEIARLFGEGFAARLAGLPPGAWTGPVESGYGVHLVLVRDRAEGRQPALGEVREAVLRDWQSARVEAARESYYQSLREGYTVVIEDRSGQSVAAADAGTTR
jgi:hypothetical protein